MNAEQSFDSPTQRSPLAWADTPWTVAALLGAWGAMIGIEEFTFADAFMLLAGLSCIYKLLKECILYKSRRWVVFAIWIAVIVVIVGVDFQLTQEKKRAVDQKNQELPQLRLTVGNLQKTITNQNLALNTAQSKSDQKLSDIGQQNMELKKSVETKDAALVTIARQQYALNYAPQIAPIYNASDDELELLNKGKTNIEIWGGKVATEPMILRDKPVIIAPETFEGYYNFKKNMARDTEVQRSHDGIMLVDCKALIRTLDHKRYVLFYKVRLTMKDGEVTKIDSFSDGIMETDWSLTNVQ